MPSVRKMRDVSASRRITPSSDAISIPWYQSIGKPSSANLIAGASVSARSRVPKRCSAVAMPCTMPGVATDRGP